MRWTTNFEHPDHLNFIIQDAGEAGFYICIYEDIDFYHDDLVSIDGSCHKRQDEYLQDTLEIARDFTLEKFGVPEDSWVQVK